ncbi:Cytochrome P450 71D10 [Hordeum vulgare]|nr:Cytochrome P450 71D10 [Hordeum vulgare]
MSFAPSLADHVFSPAGHASSIPLSATCSVASRADQAVPLCLPRWEDSNGQVEVIGGHDEVELVKFKRTAMIAASSGLFRRAVMNSGKFTVGKFRDGVFAPARFDRARAASMQMEVIYLGVALVSTCIVLLTRCRSSRKANEPPGPWQLPVIGSLHHLALARQLPHHTMCDLARRHGPVMYVDLAFATRPLNATMRILTDGGRYIVFAPYGEYWRQLRKEEVASMLRDVAQAAATGRPVQLRARVSALVTDITARTVMGDRQFKQRAMFLGALDRSAKLAAGFNPPDLWPSSRLVGYLSGAKRRAKECCQIGDGVFDAIISGRAIEGQKEHNLLDGLPSVTEFPATLEWAITELVKNPKVMQKAAAEVRKALEARGTVAEQALGDLPYMHLVIRETLRLHTHIPLLLPRECREPCQVLGYDVPRGTQVLVNVWALALDDRYWDESPKGQ